jgi:hypothetical protein
MNTGFTANTALAILAGILAVTIMLRSGWRQPSVILYVAAIALYTQVLRPITTISFGSTILTLNQFDIGRYTAGLLAANVYLLMFSIGYVLVKRRSKVRRTGSRFALSRNSKQSFYVAITGLLITTIIMLLVGGKDILFGNRSATMTLVNPLIRYIYPFAVVFMCILFVSSYSKIQYKMSVTGVLGLTACVVSTFIIGQRGFLIGVAAIAYTLYVSPRKLVEFNRKTIVICSFAVLALFSKDLIDQYQRKSQFATNDNRSVSERIVSRPDGDIVEIWMLTTKYRQENYSTLEYSISNNLFNIIPHTGRILLNKLNGQDILNMYYGGAAYVTQGFGFNVTLPVELYLHYGMWGALIYLLCGSLFARATLSFEKAVYEGGRDASIEMLKLYAMWTIITSLGGFQWFILFYTMYVMLSFVLRRSRTRTNTITDSETHEWRLNSIN